MLLHRVVLLWPLLSSATEDSESLSPLAKNIIATLSSSGNAVMRRDFGHERPREDLDLRHRIQELTSFGHAVDATKSASVQPEETDLEDEVDADTVEEESTSAPGDTTVEPLESTEEATTEMPETTPETTLETTLETTKETTGSTTRSSNTSATTATTPTTTATTTAANTTSDKWEPSPTSATVTTTQPNTTTVTTPTSTTTTVTTTTTTATTTTTTKTSTTKSTTEAAPVLSTTAHHEVQFTSHAPSTTHSPAHLEAVAVGVAAAGAARAEGLSPEQQATRAGEAAAAAAVAAGLSPMEVVKAAGHAASAAMKAVGMTAVEQVRAAVLAAEIAAQKVGLSPEEEATAAAAVALWAAKSAGLSHQEVVVVAGKVVASVRHDLRDVLAAKIKEIHASTRPASKNLDQVVEAAAAAAAAAASSAAAAADASAQVAHNVEANNTPTENAPPGAEEDVKAMLKKLSEQVLETSSRLEEIEKHERELSDELADKADKAEAPKSNETEDLSAKVETKSEGAAPSSVKVPGYMNANEATTYWTQDSEASHGLEKPVHPHNLQDAVMTAEDVAALSPEQVAAILTRDRELLAEVTAKLSSANLTDLVFDTDASKLPRDAPSEKALDAIMENPTIARKALNLTISVLGRGVRKLSSGKALSDELFGSDTSHLIAEEVKAVSASTSESSDEAKETGVIKGAVAPAADQAAKSEDGDKATTSEAPGTKVLGVELPSISLPSFSMPSIPNPMAWFR